MAKGYSLAALAENLYKLVYPVGICIDFWDGTNPNERFPGTTWVLIDDGRHVRASNTRVVGTSPGQIGSLGGQDTVTITEAQMPVHSHTNDHVHGMNHTHPRTWVSSEGAHAHTINSGGTHAAGNHQHHFISLTQFNGAGATPAAVYAGAQRDSYTDAAGEHTHGIWGTVDTQGAHGHWFDLQWHNGNTGGVSNNRTSNTGGGAAMNIEPRYRCYGRWRRTA